MSKNLYVSLYPEKNIERVNELVECLKRNSKVFDTIFVLAEESERINFIPKELSNIVLLPVTVRPTFRTFFNAVNNITKEDDINVVANSDVYFEELIHFPKINECYALCRYEVKKNGPTMFLNRFDSQDAWLFKSSIRMPRFADFHMGIGGCDNRLAAELLNCGYTILNPSLTIKIFHLHEGAKSYDGSQKVQRPYHFLPPIELT